MIGIDGLAGGGGRVVEGGGGEGLIVVGLVVGFFDEGPEM